MNESDEDFVRRWCAPKEIALLRLQSARPGHFALIDDELENDDAPLALLFASAGSSCLSIRKRFCFVCLFQFAFAFANTGDSDGVVCERALERCEKGWQCLTEVT